jgi:uracil-DNA glycosylase
MVKARRKSSPLKLHLSKWEGCKLCPLHETRTRMVFSRGIVPADVLFIGEGGGENEDALGIPFIGPAGKCLDQIVEAACELAGFTNLRAAYTNLVCCRPTDEEGQNRAPTRDEAKACSPRLQEFIGICKPKLIVTLGTVPAKLLALPKGYTAIKRLGLVHPSFILKMKNDSQAAMAFKQSVVRLSTVLRWLKEEQP